MKETGGLPVFGLLIPPQPYRRDSIGASAPPPDLAMLVVNADDLGHDRATSDAIREAFAHGAITSATAMVFMADSERGFRLAAEAGLPIGLHLNLMETYSGAVDSADRAEQAWAVERFQSSFAGRWAPSPRLLRTARRCVRLQLAEFERLRGAPPTHVDGHQHGHLSTPALLELDRAGGLAIRSSFTFRPGEKPRYNLALRSLLNRGIASRFASTRRFHSIRDLHPALGGDGIEAVIAEAREVDVEVMCHPGLADELELLLSAEWGRMISAVPTGSFADLPGRAAVAG
jgi:chitin disaccharide deacetylase